MSIPKEPRQLMINIMYLVLTALLALNVSAEIFNAFDMVDKGLQSANASLDQSNSSLPETIRARAEKSDEFTKYADRIDVVQGISSEATTYIDDIVNTLIDESGNRNEGVDDGDYILDKEGNRFELRGKKDYNSTTRLMVDQGEGAKLEAKMLE